MEAQDDHGSVAMTTSRTARRRAASIALMGLLLSVTATTAAARPPSHYRNWAQTPGNTAGVVFHPHGDVFELWHNRTDGTPHVVFVEFNYKGINDRWKPAVRQIVIGRTHFRVRRNVLERRRIFFRIASDRTSPISEYRTSGR
jgi:hypothetical protein